MFFAVVVRLSDRRLGKKKKEGKNTKMVSIEPNQARIVKCANNVDLVQCALVVNIRRCTPVTD